MVYFCCAIIWLYWQKSRGIAGITGCC